MSDDRNRDGMDELRDLGGEEYGDTGGQSGGDGSGKATGRKRRVIVGALIAIFAAGMVFAGWNVIGAAMANNRRAHAAALADCRSARTDYIRTYTSYTPAMSKAATLLKRRNPSPTATPATGCGNRWAACAAAASKSS